MFVVVKLVVVVVFKFFRDGWRKPKTINIEES